MAAYIPINSGELDKAVIFVTLSYDLDANRSPTVTATPNLTPHWARIRYLSGTEFQNRGQVIGDANVEIAVRRFTESAALKTKDRIVDDASVAYEIVSIHNPHERGEYLIFMCSKVEAQS